MATTIKLKNGSGAPAASDLVQGEPAIDLTNKRLYTENASGVVIEVGSNPSSLSINGTAVTATAAEINTLDGITSSTAELNILDGVTSTAAELNILDGVTSTTAELNILDGVTSTAAELNILDGVTSTTAELNILDGVTATTAELNILDGVTSTTAELNILDGVTSTATELNILDGVTSSTAELNILDGVTSTTAELNILDGVTSTAAELNILDGKAFLDEDDMSSNSATGIPSQQSVKAYVDANAGGSSTLAGLSDTNITSPADASLLFYDTGTSKWIDNVVSGDITIADTGVAAIGSGVIVNADVNASAAIDVSKTALTAGTGLTLSTNTLSVDASQTQITAVGTIGTGTWQGTAIADAYVANDLTISGGAVDNTVIGGTTAAAGTFTTFTSNGIDDNANAVAITIDSDERVLIGTDSGDAFNSDALLRVQKASAPAYIQIKTDNNQNGGLLFGDTDDDFRGGFFYENGSDQLSVYANDAERLRVTANGLTFNGDTAAANALDDYEEGSWTPTASSNITTIANVSGNYTKIGNLVTVSFYADITPTSSTTQMKVGGLPYAVADKISNTSFEATGIIFEDSSLYFFAAFGGSSDLWIELDRPMEGSASTGTRSYRGSVTYYTS